MDKDKLLFSVGKCSKGEYKSSVGGKFTKVYDVWKSMIMRCYSEKYQETRPSYKGCSVCDEWIYFQNFAEWYYNNYPKDGGSYQLDKDLKNAGNKLYSPETCLFVPTAVNNFIIDRGVERGPFLIGVSWDNQRQKYLARCRNPFTKKQEYLGLFTSELSAHLTWRKRKSDLAYELAIVQENEEIKEAILNWKKLLDDNRIHVVM